MRDESQRDERVMELVTAALERTPETRRSYLRSACADDTELYLEVEELLGWEERMDGFLTQPAIAAFEMLDRPFEPGELVAGRFRILLEVGRGGMGVVYEAQDEKLDRRVAVKASLRGHDHHLPPEARAAREVSHFNVCKVHELHVAQTEMGEVDFLTMEFIEGETLAERIRRAGPLPAGEAREIARQICAGLAQAHRQGVIHGDLKCGNVILAPASDGSTRAVITDFGLATLRPAGEEHGRLAPRGGSFDYMAPELFSGARAGVASDLYALGVVLHVMLTGKMPAYENPPKLSESASTATMGSAGQWQPEERRCEPLPWPWSRIVKRCVERDPDDRFASADEIRELIDTPPPARRWIWAVPAAAAILTAAFWLGRAPAGPAVRLAVLPIAVEGAAIPTASGLAVDLADRLAGVRRGFVVIPPGEAQRNRVDTPEKAKTVLAATHVLRTRLRNSGNQIQVAASVSDIGSGQTLAELHAVYAPNDVLTLAKALTATVTGAFHLRTGISMEPLAAAAYPAYIQGITLLHRDGLSADEAIPYFEKAIQLDPNSALPYAALAQAQLQKFSRGYGPEWSDRASQALAKAQSLNSDSPLVLQVAGYFRLQHGQYEQAAEDFKRALEIAPTDSDSWQRLADTYAEMNQISEAIATYQKAIQAQPDYYAPYIRFGRFYNQRGQFVEAEQLFRHAVQVAPGLAEAYWYLGLALSGQMRFAEAEQSWLKSLDLLQTPLVLTDLGSLYYKEERYPEAIRYFEKSLQMGSPQAIQYWDLADAYQHVGRSADAAEMYRRAQKTAESELISNPRDPMKRLGLAYASAKLGEHNRAEFEAAQALTLSPDSSAVDREAAFTFEALGERDGTLRLLSGAPLSLLEELSREPDMKGLRDDPRFQELLRNKMTQP
jgi:tetratricopeptide (TPR) repeat protein/tRNA A-37 threonylcarbamoyl transferase component Bud32